MISCSCIRQGIEALDWEKANIDKNGLVTVPCKCCGGNNEHQARGGPNRIAFTCDTCEGYGEFWVMIPHSNIGKYRI